MKLNKYSIILFIGIFFIFTIYVVSAEGQLINPSSGSGGVSNYTNIALTNQSVTWDNGQNVSTGVGGWFKGLFNWVWGSSSSTYATFNGSTAELTSDTLKWLYNQTQAVYDNQGNLNVNKSDFLDTYDSSYFMPINTSVRGNFDFNGGWQSGGLTIIDGNVFAQTGFFYNITGLNASLININTSILPINFDNQFDIGNATWRWRNGYFGTEVYIDGLSVKQWLYNQTSPALIISNSSASFLVNNTFSLISNNTFSLITNNTFSTIGNNTFIKLGAINSTIISYKNITDIPSCSGGNVLTFDGTDLSCVSSGATNIFDQNLNTTNSVKFANITSTGNLTISGNATFLDRVGIGTANPQTYLHVNVSGNNGILLTQALTSSTNRTKIMFLSDTESNQWQLGTDISSNGQDNFWLWERGTGFIQTWTPLNTTIFNNFSVDSPTFMVDSNNDRVGIGTTSPDNKLNVESSTTGYEDLIEISGTGSFKQALRLFIDHPQGVDTYLVSYGTGHSQGNNFLTNSSVISSIGSSKLMILGGTNVPIIFSPGNRYTTGNADMVFTSAGDLGIGTNMSANQKLQVGGNVNVTGGGNITLQDRAGNEGKVTSGSGLYRNRLLQNLTDCTTSGTTKTCTNYPFTATDSLNSFWINASMSANSCSPTSNCYCNVQLTRGAEVNGYNKQTLVGGVSDGTIACKGDGNIFCKIDGMGATKYGNMYNLTFKCDGDASGGSTLDYVEIWAN